jgi:hypothetical protein
MLGANRLTVAITTQLLAQRQLFPLVYPRIVSTDLNG